MEFDCIKELEENSYEVYVEVSSILLRLVDNVIKNPTNPKYRRIRIENAAVSEKLLPAIGAMECLFSIGFKEDGDGLLLPNDVSIKNLQSFRDKIHLQKSRLDKVEALADKASSSSSDTTKVISAESCKRNGEISQNKTQDSNKSNQSLPETPASRPDDRKPSPTTSLPNSQKSETKPRLESDEKLLDKHDLLKQIEIYFNQMKRYEDEALQAKALELIPKRDLFDKVAKQLKRLDDSNNSGDEVNGKIHSQELILSELLKWFKKSFFTWVDAPECTNCQGQTTSNGVIPSADEAISRIESFKCQTCGSEVLFPRYEDPEILLQSRKGRCGEWAKCFTLFCRALKWDARFVLDVTDHVWTEVYSIRQKRWLHCDPCELALDTPLMYEKGWGKKLSYVIAFSIEEVQDVTWRYSSQHEEICSRRNAVSEQELIDKILSLSKNRQSSFSAERNQMILHRRIAELIEFLAPPKSAEEYGGRSSGSKEWREARGEMNCKILKPHHVWKPSLEAIKNSKFHIEYSTSLDKYVDRSTGMELSGWEDGVYSAESIFRKEEFDWKTAYLARIEGSTVGKIEWKFNFESCGIAVNQIYIKCPHSVYENGTVRWYLLDGMKSIPISEGEEFVSEAAPGTSEFTLRAELENGKGSLAWQHAQLFRQSTNDSNYIFSVIFTFKPKEGNNLIQNISIS